MEQEGDKDRKGEDALPGEGGWAGAMVGDELGIVKRFGEIGKNTGMDSAKRPSLINHLFSDSYATLYTTKSLLIRPLNSPTQNSANLLILPNHGVAYLRAFLIT
ncbi:hypothetical protein sS8_3740 [Methylocaldum marinum]|uniref:Uncharacterized protein n=1 Tax=Methylocaldum marinum TaxID=1432792 RepID=A0A250KVN7_9GAMM|nr:hypothetical protein [Methylocaldum marinum]BBA35677.1 hypothetical protein sS8_3740 [Methylocaldum marinum]